MSDAREYEYGDWQSACVAAEALMREGRSVWLHPEQRTAPVEHTVWILAVRP